MHQHPARLHHFCHLIGLISDIFPLDKQTKQIVIHPESVVMSSNNVPPDSVPFFVQAQIVPKGGAGLTARITQPARPYLNFSISRHDFPNQEFGAFPGQLRKQEHNLINSEKT